MLLFIVPIPPIFIFICAVSFSHKSPSQPKHRTQFTIQNYNPREFYRPGGRVQTLFLTTLRGNTSQRGDHYEIVADRTVLFRFNRLVFTRFQLQCGGNFSRLRAARGDISRCHAHEIRARVLEYLT